MIDCELKIENCELKIEMENSFVDFRLGQLCMASLKKRSCHMPPIKRFEDLDIWRRARRLTSAIYRISSHRAFAKDFGLRDQIRKTSTSIMSNIAEGFERSGNKEFVRFLIIAKGSAGELRSQLYVAYDQEYIDQQIFDDLTSSAIEVSRMIGGFIKYLKQPRRAVNS